MAHRDLQGFNRKLEENGQLTRIKASVSPILEITEITDRVGKRGGKALLFENVEGSSFPVLMNAFGSYERMSMALGADSLEDIAGDIEKYLDFGNYTSIPGLISFFPQLLRLLCCFPLRKTVKLKRPACQQVIEREPDLTKLPVLQCWPLDGGRFFTLPLVFTKYPDSRAQNAGMYRMQVLDERTTAMHWHKHKDGAGIYEAYKKRDGIMPVSVAVGCGPCVTYAATAPLPPRLDEMMLAGFLQRRPVSMVRCVTNDIYVPEDSQFVLEGYVDTKEDLVWEGPFGDHTGYYSLAGWYPRFHVTTVTHRRKPIYPATVVGKPPMEDCYMAKATERIFLPLLKLQAPQIQDMNLPLEGVFHNLAVIAVKNEFPGAARTVMNFIWGMGQMRYTKMIVTVDSSVDPYDMEAVLEEVLHQAHSETDFILCSGPLDALDHSSNQPFYGARLGIDATKKPGRKLKSTPALSVIPVHKENPWDGRKAAQKALEETTAQIVIAVDDTVDITDRSTVMWRLLNNIDASRDLVRADGRAAFDATKKLESEGLLHPWPEDISMSEEIREKVTRRWAEYGLEELT